jgi:hypothetical protein
MNSPPEKGNGAPCYNAPIPKLELLETTSACAHVNTRTLRMPARHLHYAREICAMCGRHVRWLPKPETIERQRMFAFRFARLAMCERLSTWERNFIRDVSQRRKLSPKQQEIVNRLSATYLGATR